RLGVVGAAPGGPASALAAAVLGSVLPLVPVQLAGVALLLAAVGLPVIGVGIVGPDIEAPSAPGRRARS
ncbi:hypothetical protein GTW71_03550, partial [Streptomyces sp. SID6041]|nr:hypothetical protein [Streptomyces sp. SID6041]